VTDFFTHHGLPVLFLAVCIESFGVPVPGETALIAFAVLASQGHYNLGEVIAVAALGAIIGDNLGYWLIGRIGGPKLIARWAWLDRNFRRVLPTAEGIFQRHGGKTVFFGRFVAVLRYTVAWIAGLVGMDWWRFLVWNAAGGIVWATLVGVIAYESGKAAAEAIARYGIYAGIAVAVILIAGWFISHKLLRRVEKKL
jgi:membrane protein DedA with SNARE-associated domain